MQKGCLTQRWENYRNKDKTPYILLSKLNNPFQNYSQTMYINN